MHIISGFLGAGKTTAIRAQLEARRSEKIAVIVNDFGEASIDEEMLAGGKPFRITNIPGACVCCTAPEGFVDALGAVLESEPDRIWIEPTGLARPQDLVDTIRRSAHEPRIELEPVVVLLDPVQLDGDPGSIISDQIEAADILVANRTDLASDEQIENFERFAADLWPAPLAVQRTTQGQLDPASIEWPAGEGARVPRARAQLHKHTHSHSTDGYHARSWRWSPGSVFSRDRLTDTLAKLAVGRAGAPLARLKGVFRTQEGVFRLEVAGGQVEEGPSSFRRDSRVDVIVQADDGAALDRAGQWLEAAVLADEELHLSGEHIELVLGDGRVHLVDRDTLLALPDPIDDVNSMFPKRRGAAARIRTLWSGLGLPADGQVVIVAGDGFASEPVPVPVLCEGVLLHSIDGAALESGEGGPFRLLIPTEANPPSGACANVKGVAKLVHRAD